MKTKKTKTKKATRKFLTDLATKIYDPKTKKFLRLCTGVLKGDRDPANGVRIMHCGLGELYFAMTGRQPKHNDTEKVIIKAAKLAGFDTAVYTKEELRFRDALEKVPSINDSGMETEYHHMLRAKRVSAQFLKIAKLLPDKRKKAR